MHFAPFIQHRETPRMYIAINPASQTYVLDMTWEFTEAGHVRTRQEGILVALVGNIGVAANEVRDF